jgi:hypothetical protein
MVIGICWAFTKAVVAICVELVPWSAVGAVGAVGVPVKVGEASDASEETATPLS